MSLIGYTLSESWKWIGNPQAPSRKSHVGKCTETKEIMTYLCTCRCFNVSGVYGVPYGVAESEAGERERQEPGFRTDFEWALSLYLLGERLGVRAGGQLWIQSFLREVPKMYWDYYPLLAPDGQHTCKQHLSSCHFGGNKNKAKLQKEFSQAPVGAMR